MCREDVSKKTSFAGGGRTRRVRYVSEEGKKGVEDDWGGETKPLTCKGGDVGDYP